MNGRSPSPARPPLPYTWIAVLLLMMGCTQPVPTPEPHEREPDYYRAHEVLRHVHQPLATRVVPVPDHPNGQITLHTNAQGFRSDTEHPIPKPPDTVRVLVTGDSHTDGVVDNVDSFAPALARRLRMAALEAGRDVAFDVVNGGTGYWGPVEYGSAFSVWKDLEPDWCVVVLYEGNDFLDVVASEERSGLRALQRIPDHYQRLEAIGSVAGERVSQQLNQDLLFAHDVVAARDSVHHAGAALLAAHTACALQEAPLLLVRLPPVGAVHPPTAAQEQQIRAQLGDTFSLSGRVLGDRLEEWLHGRAPDLTVIDLWQPLYRRAHGLSAISTLPFHPDGPGHKHEPQRVFWSSDHHLSVTGHAVLAEVLATHITVDDTTGTPSSP